MTPCPAASRRDRDAGEGGLRIPRPGRFQAGTGEPRGEPRARRDGVGEFPVAARRPPVIAVARGTNPRVGAGTRADTGRRRGPRPAGRRRRHRGPRGAGRGARDHSARAAVHPVTLRMGNASAKNVSVGSRTGGRTRDQGTRAGGRGSTRTAGGHSPRQLSSVGSSGVTRTRN